ncbi:symmetrical bis(5'-nucleosyl)-tetraphosphatase [Limnobacter sp.]|uniref:symmetrical bis(5'-nucleosyl)-tetraphosphatase n=1 Tax=Limnobacter sp. TaxID=2003368 RepID=UPI00258FAD25|nr:symmetrical bis(5'-nucleosyl)-tetraphosphatase [Limnobacter sp.]
MTHYAIGDVQGCLDPLLALLDKIHFDPTNDALWFAGDLVNRGPKSLETLRFIHSLGDRARVVLGNHDLHLLALWCGSGKSHKSDTIEEIVQAPDADMLIDWLRAQPLALELPTVLPTGQRGLMVHAGILPQWSFDNALAFSDEVQAVLAGPDWKSFMAELYGNKPEYWDFSLTGFDRLRVIVNVCTRLRMLYADGKIDFKYKEDPAVAPEGLHPWFEYPGERGEDLILFGHWSTLNQVQNSAGYCLDTGCVWGGQLTALQLDTLELTQVPA